MPKSPIPLLLETIKIDGGTIHNLAYHQKRCDNTLTFYKQSTQIDLASSLHPPKEGLYRCRVLYRSHIESIEYIPYTAKEINTLILLPSQIEYNHKYAQRDVLDQILSEYSDYDDVILCKEGYLTDTSIANIAFYDGKQWFTPEKPLLKGTMRQKLLDEGFLQEASISEQSLHYYTHVALMNAMLGFKILKHVTISNPKGIIYDY